jgi:urea transport system ATP-binding protein
MGVNGVGKTSLLKALAGAHPFDGGTLRLDGRDLGHPSAVACARAGIAYVPQGREVFPQLTVEENLQAGLALLPRGRSGRVPEAVTRCSRPSGPCGARRGGDLSGGQQQQLAIARALVTRPRVLLLDEPTEGIQPRSSRRSAASSPPLRDEGRMAIVLVEQRFDFAEGLADEVVVLARGAVSLAAGPRRPDPARPCSTPWPSDGSYGPRAQLVAPVPPSAARSASAAEPASTTRPPSGRDGAPTEMRTFALAQRARRQRTSMPAARRAHGPRRGVSRLVHGPDGAAGVGHRQHPGGAPPAAVALLAPRARVD